MSIVDELEVAAIRAAEAPPSECDDCGHEMEAWEVGGRPGDCWLTLRCHWCSTLLDWPISDSEAAYWEGETDDWQDP